MHFPLAERFRRLRRWLLPAVGIALAPKCLVCVLGYLGVGAALGLAGPEFCGATDRPMVLPGVVWIGCGGLIGFGVWWLRQRYEQTRTK